MILLLAMALPASAATQITGAPENVAPLLASVIDRCVAEHPWWGNVKFSAMLSGEEAAPSVSASADDALLERDSEAYFAFPSECVDAGLLGLASKTPEMAAWITESGFVEFTGTVSRDESLRKRISISGGSEEITQRLIDRAQRCGADKTPGSIWMEAEVMVGKNGFETPTGVISGKHDGGISECMARNYLMDMAPDTKPSLATLIVSIAGADGKVPSKPAGIKFASARAYTEGGSSILLDLNTSALTCEQLGKARFDAPSDEKQARVGVQEVWQSDGSSAWRAIYGWYANNSYEGDQGPVSVKGDATAGISVGLPPGFTVGGDLALSLGDSISAIGCGDHPVEMQRGDAPNDTPPAPERDLSGLKLTIAGHDVAIKGAILMGKGADQKLEFSTEGLSCYALWANADVTYSVALPKNNAGQVYLSGTRIPSQMTDDYDAKDKPVLTLGKPANGVISLTAQLAYDHNGYPVILKGKADILDCRR